MLFTVKQREDKKSCAKEDRGKAGMEKQNVSGE